ncbi:hypothetical protein HDU99_002048 [Rhizoclosmatium hyalinum]|nr:hypothetical protein HDU99_002048 [Rhizoclosmatium hyalinum]
MCFVMTVKQAANAPVLEATANPSGHHITRDTRHGEVMKADPMFESMLIPSSDWLSLLPPLNFEASEALAPNPNPNSDWMAWLDGMSSFTQDSVSPPMFATSTFANTVSPALTSTSTLIPESPATLNSPFINKNKRVRSETPDFDDLDDAAKKRARNTEAARKSRARKAARVDSLEAQVDALEGDKARLSTRLAVLESDASSFAQREYDLKRRVALLENQLLESHRALLAKQGL